MSGAGRAVRSLTSAARAPIQYIRSMRGLLLAVILIAGASAQSPIDPAQIPALLSGISQRPTEFSLGCGFSPIPPVLDFTFRFQAGYVFRLSADQYKAGPHAWVVLTEVTPRGVDGKPSWLFARTRTDLVKTAGFNLEISGAYLLGQGSYSVESTLRPPDLASVKVGPSGKMTRPRMGGKEVVA